MIKNGFSLVEILLVIGIVAFILLIIGSLPSTFGLIGNSNHQSLAKQIATKKIEDLRSLGYDNICDPTGGPCTDPITDSRLISLPKSSGNAIISVCPINVCTSSEKVKQIEVTINWSDSGKDQSIKLSTFISKGGLQ